MLLAIREAALRLNVLTAEERTTLPMTMTMIPPDLVGRTITYILCINMMRQR